ncbi:hypothetical protein AB0D99_10440 [Streptomyces sp. NPDC047971]|uniref:hypothetical protein n=1 Tax=Streptomyces sp. NPDC047971 TaxID=3154499 RepID=UPI0033C83E9F
MTDEQESRREWLLTQIRQSAGQWTTLRAESTLRRSPWPTSGRNTARKDLRALAARGELTVWNDSTTGRRAYTSNSAVRRAA